MRRSLTVLWTAQPPLTGGSRRRIGPGRSRSNSRACQRRVRRPPARRRCPSRCHWCSLRRFRSWRPHGVQRRRRCRSTSARWPRQMLGSELPGKSRCLLSLHRRRAGAAPAPNPRRCATWRSLAQVEAPVTTNAVRRRLSPLAAPTPAESDHRRQHRRSPRGRQTLPDFHRRRRTAGSRQQSLKGMRPTATLRAGGGWSSRQTTPKPSTGTSKPASKPTAHGTGLPASQLVASCCVSRILRLAKNRPRAPFRP